MLSVMASTNREVIKRHVIFAQRRLFSKKGKVAVVHSGYPLKSTCDEYRHIGITPVALTHESKKIMQDRGLKTLGHIQLKGTTPGEAYMDVQQQIKRILDYNKKNPSDPITHFDPIYGNKSECHQTHQLITKHLQWVGPNYNSMLLGDKEAFQAAILKAGLSINPGEELTGTSKEQIKQLSDFIEKNGKAIIKPLSGGGGMGMEIISTEQEAKIAIQKALAGAKATGENRIRVENFIDNIRHIEVQVLDQDILGLRDCTLQSKRQKRLETTLPPILDKYRQDIMKECQAILDANQYKGPGTFELGFKIDPKNGNPVSINRIDKNGNIIEKPYIWIEVNTRFQVEKWVTQAANSDKLAKNKTTQIPIEFEISIKKALLENESKETINNEKNHVFHVRLNAQTPDPNHHTTVQSITVPNKEELEKEGYRVSLEFAPGVIDPNRDLQFGRLMVTYPRNIDNPIESWNKTKNALIKTLENLEVSGTRLTVDNAVLNILKNKTPIEHHTTTTIDDNILLSMTNPKQQNTHFLIQAYATQLATLAVNGPLKLQGFRHPDKRPKPIDFQNMKSLQDIINQIPNPKETALNLMEKQGVSAWAEAVHEETGGIAIEDVSVRDMPQSLFSSITGKDTLSLVSSSINKMPLWVLSEGAGGAAKQVAIRLNNSDIRNLYPHYPKTVKTELSRGLCIQSLVDITNSQQRRFFYDQHRVNLMQTSNIPQIKNSCQLAHFMKIFTAGNGIAETAISCIEAAESGLSILPTITWDPESTPEETELFASQILELLLNREEIKKIINVREVNKISIKDISQYSKTAALKSIPTEYQDLLLSYPKNDTVNKLDSLFRRSVIPKGFYLKNPGTHTSWNAETALAHIKAIQKAAEKHDIALDLIGVHSHKVSQENGKASTHHNDESIKLLNKWKDKKEKKPVLLYSTAPEIADTHPHTEPILEQVFGVDVEQKYKYTSASKLADRIYAAYSIKDLTQNVPQDSLLPGGARAHMQPTLAAKSIDKSHIEHVHNLGREIMSGRVSVTPRSQENVQLGATLVNQYQDYLITELQFDVTKNQAGPKGWELTLINKIHEDIDNNTFDYDQIPEGLIPLYSRWEKKSAYSTKKSEAFRNAILKNRSINLEESRSEEPTIDDNENIIKLQIKTKNPSLNKNDLALSTAFPEMADGLLANPYSDKSVFGDELLFGDITHKHPYTLTLPNGIKDTLYIQESGKINPDGTQEVIMKSDTIGIIKQIIDHDESIRKNAENYLNRLPEKDPNNPLSINWEPKGQLGIIIKGIEPNTTITISKDEPSKLEIVSEIQKMQIVSNILAHTKLDPGTYIIRKSELTQKTKLPESYKGKEIMRLEKVTEDSLI